MQYIERTLEKKFLHMSSFFKAVLVTGAPQLFEQIKIMCDESEDKGLFWLTVSQHFHMMKNIQETLAGRIGILERGNGGILCMCEEVIPIDDKNCFIPCNLI